MVCGRVEGRAVHWAEYWAVDKSGPVPSHVGRVVTEQENSTDSYQPPNNCKQINLAVTKHTNNQPALHRQLQLQINCKWWARRSPRCPGHDDDDVLTAPDLPPLPSDTPWFIATIQTSSHLPTLICVVLGSSLGCWLYNILTCDTPLISRQVRSHLAVSARALISQEYHHHLTPLSSSSCISTSQLRNAARSRQKGLQLMWVVGLQGSCTRTFPTIRCDSTSSCASLSHLAGLSVLLFWNLTHCYQSWPASNYINYRLKVSLLPKSFCLDFSCCCIWAFIL